jgi:hypothetical protein
MNHVVEGCNTPEGVGSLVMRIVSKICANPLFIFTRQGSLFPQEFLACSPGLQKVKCRVFAETSGMRVPQVHDECESTTT